VFAPRVVRSGVAKAIRDVILFPLLREMQEGQANDPESSWVPLLYRFF